jgi:hypothetical protein
MLTIAAAAAAAAAKKQLTTIYQILSFHYRIPDSSKQNIYCNHSSLALICNV